MHSSLHNRRGSILFPTTIIISVAAAIMLAIISCGRRNSSERQDEYEQLLSRPLSSLIEKGDAYYRQQKFDSAYLMYAAAGGRYDKSMNRADKLACERAYNNAGYLSHIYYYDYPQAYAQLLKSLQIADDVAEQGAYPYIYINIGNLMCASGNWVEGMEYQKKAMRAALSCGDTVGYLKASANLFSECIMEGEIEEYKDVLESFPERRGSGALWNYTGKLHDVARSLLGGDYKAASSILHSIEKDEHGVWGIEERLRFFRFFMLARIAEHQGENRNAIVNLKSIEDMNYEQPELQSYLYEALSDNYKKLGIADSAAIYKLKFAELTDLLRPVQKQATIYELKNAYETRAINFRMELLSRERQVLIRVVWIVAFFSLIVVALLISVIISRRRTLRAKRELYERNQELIREIDSRRTKVVPDPTTKAVSSDTAMKPDPESDIDRALLERIQVFFDSSEEIYEPDFSVEKMAATLGVPVRKISKTINDGMGHNFSTTLQTYRIREACRRLSDTSTYGNLTVEGIAESLGFRSRSNFNAVFKKKTGLTPAAWQKIAKQDSQMS